VAEAAVERLQDWLREERARRRVHCPSADRTVVEETGGGRFDYRYDRRGDLVGIAGPGGAGAAFAYDADRRLTRAQRGAHVTRFVYEGERLREVKEPGRRRRFEYDAAGRLVRDGANRFAYDELGRIVEARTPAVTTTHDFDADGRLAAIRQEIDGVTIEARMAYGADGRLATLQLPGDGAPIAYQWDGEGRPLSVALGGAELARWTHARHAVTLVRANGVVERLETDPVDSRPLRLSVTRGTRELLARTYVYDRGGRLTGDGVRRYMYDPLGRLARVDEPGAAWTYGYDGRDNLVAADGPAGTRRFACDEHDRLVEAAGERVEHDERGRRTHEAGPRARAYRYDDTGHLSQVLERGAKIADLTYDHKGRLTLARYRDHTERYLYGGDDELLAVTDGAGRPLRLIVRTPLGVLAEVDGAAGVVRHLHCDRQGVCHLITGEDGKTLAAPRYCPFGTPLTDGPARFGFREWHPRLALYRLDSRWYDPATARFLEPDTFTAGPDDERLVHPLVHAGGQAAARAAVLGTWLQRPRLANRYVYCANDPVNRLDPSGHWSFGGVLLTLLGVVWTLPNTVIGLLIEILCLIGEVVRWIAWLVSGGAATWETPGFDAAASGHLNAFALVFVGGWLGSFPTLHGITFGNVFFVYGRWDELPEYTGSGVVYPPAYDGKVAIPVKESLYEHELRHTNQYGWLGPFFLLVYLFDAAIINGYANSAIEEDARRHAEGPPHPPAETTTSESETPEPGVPLYGGYDLQRGDRDQSKRWGGVERAEEDTLPADGEIGYVRRLQQDLTTLGFRIVGPDDGSFGRCVMWAVRELQGHGKMANVAREEPGATGTYVERLRQVANEEPYAGPVSGVVDQATREVIRTWLTNRWRCPVVIRAAGAGATPGAPVAGKDNVWFANEVTARSPYLFAHDFSGHYTLPAGRAAGDPIAVGRYEAYGRFGGPVTETPTKKRAGHTWPEAEMLPERLVGAPLASLSGKQRSTYKVVRAVAEQECIGFYDGINAYDNAFVSLGACHWTLGIVFEKQKTVERGELLGFLAYLRAVEPDAFAHAIEWFGMRPDREWVDSDGVANGAPLFDKSARKYVGWPALQAADGTFAEMPRTEDEGNWFKSWHWIYRFEMAGRTLAPWQRRMWHMARIRLRDIRSAPWPASAGVPAAGGRPATIGDVYSSERAAAYLLRWHVYRPAHIVSGGEAGPELVKALKLSGAPNSDPTTWSDVDQAKLIQGLWDHAQAVGTDDLKNTLMRVRDWPSWASDPDRPYALDPAIGALIVSARSFDFDDSDLPPAPAYS
jgi:RHS repeat-associated protein